MSQVVQLVSKPKLKPQVVRSRRAIKRQSLAASGIGIVAGTLTILSLSHLAHGIALVTGAPTWQAWSMAIGIDLSFVALELSQLTVGDKLRKAVAAYARPAIAGTLIGSAGLNAFAFVADAHGLAMQAAAVILGVAIPGLIYALTRVGAVIAMNCQSRA
jgi:hypothetical protein